MANHSLSSTEDLVKKNVRYSSRSVAPTINHTSYSRHLSSRYETRSLNGKTRTIIHVSIKPTKNSSHSNENKSRNTNNYLHSSSIHETNHTGIISHSARQTQNATTFSLQTNETSLSDESLTYINKSVSNQRNDEIIFQTNHLSSKTNRILTHNNQIPRINISSSNIKDLGEYSGERKKKRCPRIMTCKCSWALIFLLTALLLAIAITSALLVTLIKPDTIIATTTTTSSTIITTETTTTTDSPTTTTTTTESTTPTTTESITLTTTVTISMASTTSTTVPSSTNVSTTTSGSAYFAQEKITVSCLTTLKNITIQIIVQKTVGATYSSPYSTFWGGTINQSYTTNSTVIVYTWTIISGQTILCSGGPYQAVAQFNLIGTPQITTADTYSVTTTTSAGVTTTLTGHF